MFKKELKVSSNNQIQKQDRDKIREDISKFFDASSVAHFAKAYKKIVQLKIQGKNGGTQLYIFTNDEYPILVDPTKKGDYFPTVYACTAFPDLIPSIYINKGVEEYLYKGAQLMWPGVKNVAEMGKFQNDDLRRIVSDDGTVVGIGAMACSSEELDQQDTSEGVCCMVLHHNKDKLYEMGEGKLPQVIWSHEIQKKIDDEELRIKQELEEIKKKAQEQKQAENQENNDEEEEDDILQMANFMGIQKKSNNPKVQYEQKQKVNHFKEDEEVQQQQSKNQKKSKGKSKKNDDEDEEEEIQKEEETTKKNEKNKKSKADNNKKEEPKKGKGKDKKNSEQVEEQGEQESTQESTASNVNVKEIDNQIKEAFLNAVKLSIDDKMFPMDPTVLYNQHMQNCKGPDVKVLDFKNSSWKKIGVFMNYLKKEKFIEYKEGKKGAAPMIQSINRNHKEIEAWELTIGGINKKDDEKDDEKDQDLSIVSKVVIEEFFRPGVEVAEIFGGKDSVKNQFSQGEIQKYINEYIKANCKTEKKNIVLDPYLAKLFPPEEASDDDDQEEEKKDDDEEEEKLEEKKPKKPKTLNIVDSVTKERLGKKIESKLQIVHTITNTKTGEKKTYNSAFKGIQVIAEKAHNKNITKIVGLEQFGINLESLASRFQLQFACSCTLHESHTKGAGKDLQVQGNNLSEIVEFLEKESKIDKRYIKEQDKINSKKKVKQFQK